MLEKALACQMEFLLMERVLIDTMIPLSQMALIMQQLTSSQVSVFINTARFFSYSNLCVVLPCPWFNLERLA